MNTLTTQETDRLYELAASLKGRFRTDYSGRGMSGEKCVGIDVYSAPEMMKFGIELTEILGRERALAMARATRTDSMGRGMIVYFEGWQAPEGYRPPAPFDDDDE